MLATVSMAKKRSEVRLVWPNDAVMRRSSLRTTGIRQPRCGTRRTPVLCAPHSITPACSTTASVDPSPSTSSSSVPAEPTSVPVPNAIPTTTSVAITPMFSATGAAAASAKRPWAFMTAPPISATP